MRFSRRFVFFLTLAALFPAGCFGPKPASLEGTVTLDGQPVTGGMVYIMPDGAKGNSGRPTMAAIADGKFSVPPKFGVFSGPYVITVRESEMEVPEPIEGEEVVIEKQPASSDDRMRFPSYTLWHDFPKGANHHTLSIEMPKARR